MAKKYFMLEGVEGVEGEKELILYHQLKKIIRYLNDCEVMEVLSDNGEAFDLMFHHIIYLITKSDDTRPTRFSWKNDDEETIFESTYFQEKHETERLKKRF